jgi:Cu+-exporting ATPase
VNTCRFLNEADTTDSDQALGQTDLWLFTDPAARVAYVYNRHLNALREDILANVLFDGSWAPDELALKGELRRLLTERRIVAKGTFGYVSPHPTVYRAVAEGTLRVARESQRFCAGDDLVFVPWLLRVARPGQIGPVRIGHLHSIGVMCLCDDAFPSMEKWCGRNRALLHNTLYPGKLGTSLHLHVHSHARKNGSESGGNWMVKDPVCAMQIDPNSIASKSTYEGRIYCFCSSDCRKKFDLDPERYAERKRSNPTPEPN